MYQIKVCKYTAEMCFLKKHYEKYMIYPVSSLIEHQKTTSYSFRIIT